MTQHYRSFEQLSSPEAMPQQRLRIIEAAVEHIRPHAEHAVSLKQEQLVSPQPIERARQLRHATEAQVDEQRARRIYTEIDNAYASGDGNPLFGSQERYHDQEAA